MQQTPNITGIENTYLAIVTNFTQQEAIQALESCLNCSNNELQKFVSYQFADTPNAIVIKLSLLVAVMRLTNIQRVITYPSVGSCPGVIIDECFWNNEIMYL